MNQKRSSMMNPQDYRQYIRRKWLVLGILVVAVVFSGALGIAVGSSNLSIGTVFRTLAGFGSKKDNVIIFNLRLPRSLTAIIAGFGLGIVGCVMQSVLRNPLASASTIGVSQGAAFGAAFAIIVLGAGIESVTSDSLINVSNPYIVSTCAFVGSMVSTLFILVIARLKKLKPATMVLTGVALGSLFSGAETLLEYFADDVKVAAVVYWTFGDVGSTNWNQILIMAVVTFAAFVFFYFNRWNYNAIQSGEETAKGLGVNTDALLLASMVVCALDASIIVAYIGIISFIGLIAPHFVRKLVGSDYRFLMPASGLAGAVLLLVADIVARMAVAPIVLPIGAITSFIGAPVFLMIILREGKKQ